MSEETPSKTEISLLNYGIQMDPSLKLDRIRGAFAAHFLGDALGGPYEFYWGRTSEYTGILDTPLEFRSRFQPPKLGAIGQTTDDTAMTLIIFEQLLQGPYDPQKIIEEYHKWAVGAIMVGKNTRALVRFKAKPENVYKCYQTRYNKKFSDPAVAEAQQSNGALMRCLPFVLLKDWEGPAGQDCYLTNPSDLAWETNYLYLLGMQALMQGYSGQKVWKYLKDNAENPELVQLFDQESRDLKYLKGWCLNAFWCFLQALTWEDTLPGFYAWLISEKGDTDTNMAIAGAALGARLGFEQMMLDRITAENWQILTEADVSESQIDPRQEYQGRDLLPELEQYFSN